MTRLGGTRTIASGHPRGGRHQPRPGGRGRGGALPRGSALPPEHPRASRCRPCASGWATCRSWPSIFCELTCERFGMRPKTLSPEALARLAATRLAAQQRARAAQRRRADGARRRRRRDRRGACAGGNRRSGPAPERRRSPADPGPGPARRRGRRLRATRAPAVTSSHLQGAQGRRRARDHPGGPGTQPLAYHQHRGRAGAGRPQQPAEDHAPPRPEARLGRSAAAVTGPRAPRTTSAGTPPDTKPCSPGHHCPPRRHSHVTSRE